MSWANYDDALLTLKAEGFDVTGLDIGRMVRVKRPGHSQKGWYILHEITLDDGERHLIGSYGYWAGAEAITQKIKPGKGVRLTDEQKQAIAERHRIEAAKAKAERARKAEKAAHAASRAWRQYLPTGESDYLERKGVQAYGLRFSPSGNGTVAVPMMDERGQVHGLQLIRGKDRGNKLEKEYWPAGLNKTGHYHLIGGTPRGICIVCEGYATAASLHEALGSPVAVAFDAGNLLPVAKAISKVYRGVKVLVCADDDYRTTGNPGVTSAQMAALAVSGSHLAPVFADPRPEDRKGPTDFNDLHALEGLAVVRAKVETHLHGLGWLDRVMQSAHGVSKPGAVSAQGGGDKAAPMPSMMSIDDAAGRYWGTYGLGGKVLFDEQDRRLVHKDDVLNLLPGRSWDLLKGHPGWRVARDNEIGFDPTESDPEIRCNLFGGWPTTPQAGECTKLLELLEYQCSNEINEREVYDWILKWLAYPIQHRGAKMHSAIVFHGPQGTGKSRFFEAYGQIFGPYFQVIGQDALEDKFNSDWAEKKLFVIGDEVLARQDMFHVKNRLKGFITSPKIRVNPKGVAAHTEKNQMNIVFLSNERMPLVLENDDRRHLVVWVPPKLDESFFTAINDEIEAGGIEALHHFLINLDLGDFRPWTKPPMTGAKQDLIELGRSSEERFFAAWKALEVEYKGKTVPFMVCAGSSLFKVYRQWCEDTNERNRGERGLVSYIKKMPGWSAGRPLDCYRDLKTRKHTTRRLVVPPATEIQEVIHRAATLATDKDEMKSLCGPEHKSDFLPDERKAWLTESFFYFNETLGLDQ